MSLSDTYGFRKVTREDLGLLQVWQANPHVAAWWDAGAARDDVWLADPLVARWMVSAGGRPFAFMQDYSVHAWPGHHFRDLPLGSRGIDQYIGEAGMIGLGHGRGFIGQRMRAIFDQGAPVIATDPHPGNARAIAVYRSLGFDVAGAVQETEWGLILPMLARA